MANDINISWGAQNLNIGMQTQEINVAFDGNIFNEPVTFSNWYIYIAYASDTNGTGFSTTPSGSLKYIGVLNTTTLVNDLNASYYVGKWFKYIGDDGAGVSWVNWGEIVGSILDQSDLQNALSWKSDTGHTHDDRYYTETEADALLSWKANTSHTHSIANVTGLQTALDGKQATLGFTPENSANKWQANGFAPLDATGKVPLGNMPASLIGSINYQGSWDASTNTPALSDGTGSKWLYYIVGTWWSQNLGSWAITFDAGDWVVHNGTTWQRFNDGDVSSVNGQNGVVVLDTSHINDTADKRYVTDAEKTKLSNTSGVNTGDQDLSPYFHKTTDDSDDIIEGSVKKFMTTSEKSKLSNISITQPVDLDAIETRVNELDASVVLKWVWDASIGTFPWWWVAKAWWSYIVSVAWTVDGVAFNINDRIIAITNNASTSTFASNRFKADYTDQVLSVNGNTWTVVITKTDIWLSNVDNTSDANKPISNATQTALNNKQQNIQFKDEWVNIWSLWWINTINIKGAWVSASESGGVLDIDIPGWWSSIIKWIAEVDFGPIIQNNDIASVTIANTSVTSTSYPTVTMYAIATTDHDPDDYMAEWLIPYITNVINGVWFDISVRAPNLTWWKYKVVYSF